MLKKKILKELQEYIESREDRFVVYNEALYNESRIIKEVSENELDVFINNNRKPSFKQILFRFIDQTGASDPEIYHKAGMDRKHFSKIRSNPNYRPRKNVIIALALALELNKDKTDTLLASAGYSFSDSDTSDLVVQFCLEKGIYTIHDVNQALNYFSLKPLIG
ncbi:hypothetical protein CFK37_02585 [Virgibacillus phasianinus]|uniref:Appr-1-p processing protein n=1 Tax=Virgibacillus phasianinus TaxID=2017483 RepID=A0A220TZ98_9BACI|nr:hypothetical protein [Virgibacillus phasianinus]ASK61157.1 hypothetical protein CFK37_02585 [Virgibacillus phasianinus]